MNETRACEGHLGPPVTSRRLTKGEGFDFRGHLGVTGSILVVLEASRFWSVPSTLVAARVGWKASPRTASVHAELADGDAIGRAEELDEKIVGTALRTPTVNPLVIRDIAALWWR